MRFRDRRRPTAAVINITPMIDVMFLLVLWVFLSAKFEPEGGISVQLPTGKSAEMPDKPQTAELVVLPDDRMYLQKEKVRLDELSGKLKALRETMKDPILIISADKDVPYQRIIAVTDCAKMAGQAKLNLKIKP